MLNFQPFEGPTVGNTLDHVYVLHGHRVRVVTLDLNQPWRAIETQLVRLIAVPMTI